MKQIEECLDRLFSDKIPLKKKWKAFKFVANIKDKNRTCVFLYHYHHHVLTYDLESGEVLDSWWEKPADKRGLDAALQYLKNRKKMMSALEVVFPMEKVEIKIDTTNAAFDGDDRDANHEVARILRKIADDLEMGNEPTIVRDINGNKCGTIVIE